MITPIQLSVTIRKPLFSVDACTALANQDRAAILNAITTGAIRYAFDLRTPGAGKPAIRVLVTSLRDWMNGAPLPAGSDTAANLQAVVSDLFPALTDTIRTENVVRILSVSREHLYGLLRQRLVRTTREGKPVRGHHALFARRSVIEFLVRRRMT